LNIGQKPEFPLETFLSFIGLPQHSSQFFCLWEPKGALKKKTQVSITQVSITICTDTEGGLGVRVRVRVFRHRY
jgi:hypothetical protein